MKKFYFWAPALAAILTMAACTAEDDIVVSSPDINPPNEETPAPILFSSLRSNITRAGADITGAEAAKLLGNRFVVFGYKGSTTATPGSTVFDNYQVKYKENTAYTTESNVANWEYVGQERIKHAIDNGVTQQTIKFWDYSKDQYDFIAWATGFKDGDPTKPIIAVYDNETDHPTLADREVRISAINPATATTAAYTFTGKAADLKDCFIADLVTVKKADYSKATGENPVTIKFRSLGSKVRIGIYETVPGYSVKDVKFYSAAASNDAQGTPKLFTTTANNIYTEGTYTIYFPTVDDVTKADNNQAHIEFSGTGTQSSIVNFGAMNYTIAEDGEKTAGKVFLGRTSNTATYAGEAEGNYFTQYLPNESGTNLNLRVDYTLESIDGSGETIVVKGATAQVPLIYTQWKAGYAYTYLFKISDKTNGHTGAYDPTKPDDTTVNSDPAGLYPITFDAVVVNSEVDATQETITTVSTPSITTYQKGSKVVDNNEYLAATGDIFVTVNDGTKESTPDLANGKLQTLTGKAALYTLPAGHTEAEVVDALSMRDDDAAANTIKGRSGLVLTEATFTLVDKVEYGADGNTISVGIATDQAMRFTPAAGTYAFVYTKKAATPANDKVRYEALKFSDFETGATKYRYDYKAATTSDAQKGVKYYTVDAGVYTLQTPFIGQGVSNLYADNTATTIAKGYAKTGTTYYYTPDGGQSYKAAHNVAYADFASAELYTEAAGTYTQKTDAAPVDGKAYYQRTGAGTSEAPYVYTYCVILPQQTTGWYEIDTAKYVVATETNAVDGMTYFDKFTQNDGVYYTKVIKVQ